MRTIRLINFERILVSLPDPALLMEVTAKVYKAPYQAIVGTPSLMEHTGQCCFFRNSRIRSVNNRDNCNKMTNSCRDGGTRSDTEET